MADQDTELVARLFAEEIPEIASGAVVIRAIARNPGQRTKVALESRDKQVDCIVACVGGRGARVHRVVERLDGERVDLIRWEDPPERFLKNALQPLAIHEILLDEDKKRAVVTVATDQEQAARDQRPENQDLAGRLCGWRIEFREQEERLDEE